MPSVTVELTASPSDNVNGYWISVHDKRVKMVDDQGSTDLDSPGSYILVWHFTGPEGATLGIKSEVNGTTVVQVKQSTIPKGETSGAGISRFTV